MNTRKPRKKRICSVDRTIEILGDRWSFLILREAFFGIHSYHKFVANTGIATNILSNRLNILLENGIMERMKDPDDARRNIYKLTEKGLDIYPIVLAFMQWGDRWLSDKDGPPLSLYHKKCGKRLTPVMCCDHCREIVNPREVTYKENYLKE